MKITNIKLSSKIAILSFILSFLGITALAFISYQQSNEIFKNNLIKSTAFEAEKTAYNIKKKIEEAKKNLLFASNSESIFGILRTTKNKYNYDEEQNMHLNSWKERLSKLFAVVMKQNPSYFQVRLIGIENNGKEMIRVEQKNGKLTIVDQNNLQSKAKSNYFKQTIKLKKQKIFISDINLNREYNVIETPYVPTLRVATPIYNNDKVYAIIVININVDKLFEFSKFRKNPNFDTYITNSDGQYLFHKNIDKTFGFEFGKEYLIQDNFNVKNVLDHKKSHDKFYDESINSAFAIYSIELLKNKFLYVAHVTNSNYFEKESQQYIKILILYIIGISIIIAFLIAFLLRYLTSPISKLTGAAKHITAGEDLDFESLNIKTGDEIEELANSFKFMIKSLSNSKKELQELANNLEIEVNKKTKELQKLNDELEIKVKNAIDDIREKDNVLQQQSKLASMGEMIGAIAHQWRQPLNALSIQIQGLKYNFRNGDITEDFIFDFIQKNKKTIKFMSKTIDDFRSFFRVDKTKYNFKVLETTKSVINMQEAQLLNHDIELILEGDEFEYYGLQSEFQQVILNIINNAKDALLENKIQNPKINVNIDNKQKLITICDNAGGIDKDIIKRIFEPYFTTKEQGKGTGMGLYMSKMIIEDNMNSKLTIKNIGNGSCFMIELNDEDEGNDSGSN